MDIVNEKIKEFNTNPHYTDLIYRIVELCSIDGKFVPKRTLKWIEIHDKELYTSITLETDRSKIKDIVEALIYNNEIPNCIVCEDRPIISTRFLFKPYCSNKCTIRSIEVQSKTKETCDTRYGKRFNVDSPKSYTIGTHHMQKKMINLSDIEDHDIMISLQNSPWRYVCSHFGLNDTNFVNAYMFMKKHGYPLTSTGNRSNLEVEVFDYVCSLIDIKDVQANNKSMIYPYELDILIPSHGLAIEFDGLYWHSSNDKSKDSDVKIKHIRKTNMCEYMDINLLHIFENEWVDDVKRDIWKSIIHTKLKLNKRIYARKTVLKDIDKKVAKEFCESNHLQGYCGCTYAKGLFHGDELVMVATFGKSRYNSNIQKELIRLCSKKYTTIVGGASKILKNETFLSYANRRWSRGGVYKALNMELVNFSDPCYYYYDPRSMKLYHRSSYMKHKLKNKLKSFDEELSEVDNCYNNGLRRIWDCGNCVFIKTK